MPFSCGQRLRKKKRSKLPELVAEQGDDLFNRTETSHPWMQKTSTITYQARGRPPINMLHRH